MLLKKGDITGLVILLTILLGVGAFLIFAPKTPQVDYAPVELTGSDVEVIPPVKGDVTEVKVNATLIKPGFITVHEAMGVAPGPIVAVSPYLEAGTYTDYAIPLPSGLDLSLSYLLLLFVDGGNKTYDAGVDLPVKSDGEVIKRAVTLSL